jgi:DNA-directed RNA polymerase specialized sigma24 family protein
MGGVTQILSRIDQGDPAAASELLPLVYDELRKLATQKMAQEQPGQTLQATALVHEAYLRLVDGSPAGTTDTGQPYPEMWFRVTSKNGMPINARRKRFDRGRPNLPHSCSKWHFFWVGFCKRIAVVPRADDSPL